MEVLALLSDGAASMLHLALGAGASWRRVGVRTLRDSVSLAGAKIVLVDPAELSGEALRDLVSRASDSGDTLLVIYCSLNAHMCRAISRAASVLPVEVVFSGAIDEKARLRDVCIAAFEYSVSSRVIHGIAKQMCSLPEDAQAELARIFFDGRSAPRPPLKSSAELLRRQLLRVGLEPPSRLCEVAILARAYSSTSREGKSRLRHILDDEGVSERAFRRICAKIIGEPPRRALALSDDEFVNRLITSAQRDA